VGPDPVRVDRGDRRLPGQDPDDLARGEVADGADRLVGAVGGVQGHDEVRQREQGAGRLPVPALRGLLVEVVDARATIQPSARGLDDQVVRLLQQLAEGHRRGTARDDGRARPVRVMR
jgi:hypothetical protein